MAQDPSTIALAPNPNGDPPDFDGGPTLQPAILGTGIFLITVSLIVVILRLFTGFKNTRKLHLDDYFCAGAEVLCVGYWFVLYELQIKNGIARHSWDVPVSAVTESVTKGQSVAQILASLSNPLAKGSILLFFVRLFGTLRWVTVTCYTLLVFTFVAYLAYLAALLAFCIPRDGEPWASNLTQRCASTAPGTIVMGVVALVIDLAMFLIPFLIIPKLNLSRSNKMGLATVFLFGFLIVVTTAVGLAYRVVIEQGTPDPTWHGANVSITSYTEIFGTIIVSCAPALSSFWIRTLTQTRAFQSLRTAFSLSRLRGSKASRSDLHKDPESNRFSPHESKSEYYQRQRQGSDMSQQELVEVSPPTDSQVIKKHTVITQHSEEDSRPIDRMQLRNW